ncbi:ionotropic receptor 75a-like [Phymastichus coffea]|uniref:ionotropic receptor 75a-like n=1 Tax=Phymastichus coffea TaxID=108790 RepID=UPI00273BED92|nr:ionotropic receptor 75a-like [Phymastichus coffea]
MMIGALCQQSSDIEMTRISTRIIFIFVMIFSLLLYNYYSTSIVSARLDEPIYKINDSLVEMGKMHMKIASENIVYIEYFFRLPYWETKIFFRDHWSKVPESKRFMDPEIGVPLVRKGSFAYHAHPEAIYPLIDKLFNNREICELTEVHLARKAFTMFAVNNNCTFTEIMRVGLARLVEAGLRDRQLKKWQYKKPICRKDILNATSINIYEFTPHLILLLIGVVMAIVVYMAEIINFHWVSELQTDYNMTETTN